MRNKKLFGTLLLCGSLLTALPSCDKDTIIEAPPNQAELNIQMLESYEAKDYSFISETLGLTFQTATDNYAIEYPFICVTLGGRQYKLNMNELIAFQMTPYGTLILYFP